MKVIQKEDIRIGTKFIRYGSKAKRVETVVDIHTTYNLAGEVVKVRYVTEHETLGQKVRDYDVVAVTIQRSEIIFN